MSSAIEAMPEHFTLYTSDICPFAQRVEIALKEVNAKDGKEFTRYEIDLKNKPEWYAPQINPASKVPAIAYGGPKTPPDKPSAESIKLAESLILLELVADLFPTRSTLHPHDPILLAKARFFMDAIGTKLLPAWNPIVFSGKDGAEEQAAFLHALETIQNLLPRDKIFVVSDEFTIADAAIAPFLQRIHSALKKDKGAYKVGEGPKIHEKVFGTPKFARLQKYYSDLTARKSVQETFFEDKVIGILDKRFAATRAQ